MFMELERLQKTVADLKALEYRQWIPADKVFWKPGNFTSPEEAEQDPQEWESMTPGGSFGGPCLHWWFKAFLTIPEELDGQKVTMVVTDQTSPEYLVYVDGVFRQGLDANHTELLLTPNAKAGQRYRIDLHTYHSQIYQGREGNRNDLCFDLHLAVIDEEVRALRYNLEVPGAIVKNRNDYEPGRAAMMNVLNRAINRIDFFQPRSPEFYASVRQANDYLHRELFEKLGGHTDMFATAIGHTHIDVAWLWTLGITREKTQRSFSTVLSLMEEYPEYKFISSQPQLYEYFRERSPEQYAEIKRRVAEGRWEAEGGMWVEADCNIPSGESLVRQFLFGKRFFQKEFGVDCKILWLPDVFGYSGALPQIMKKCGIDYFMTTKINWNAFNQLPSDSFEWVGIDGSRVLTHFITTTDYQEHPKTFFTTYNGILDVDNVMGAWQRYQNKEIHNDVLMSVGYGDGGGGTTKAMIENARRLSYGLPGCPTVKWGTAREYFEGLRHAFSQAGHTPSWVGELYFEMHRGTLTSMARNKRFNRKSELLFQDLELLSVLAARNGLPYPQERINRNWKTILLNQFHDILPGSSIKEVYEESREQYETVLSEGNAMLSDALTAITRNIRTAAPSVVVYNTLSYDRDDIARFTWQDWETLSVTDSDGRSYPCQKVAVNDDGTADYLFFARKVPPKGYRCYTLRQEELCAASMEASVSSVENRFFSIRIGTDGTFTSIYDKAAHREVLKAGQRGNVLCAFEDRPTVYDNWEVDLFYQEKMREVDGLKSIQVTENGPVRATIRVEREFGSSVIIQDIRFYQDIGRVDFDTFIDWKESQVLLKAAFPVDVHANTATYDIQFGNLERSTHENTSWDVARFEVCGHKWADLSEEGYGVSLLNDCKYGYDIKDGNMRLTLLKCGIYPNPDADRERHRFTYSLFPHRDGWRQAGTAAMGYNLNVPLITALSAGNPEAPWNDTFCLVRCDCGNVMVETVKKAEDDDSLILRLYEYQNRRTQVTLSFCGEINQAYECDLLENPIEEAATQTNVLTASVKPYEIKTFRVHLKG